MQSNTGRTQRTEVQRGGAVARLLRKFLPGQRIEPEMASTTAHGLRAKISLSYAESDVSVASPIRTPQAYRQKNPDLGDEEDNDGDELDQINYENGKTSSGRSLRPRQSLTLSLKAAENGYKRRYRKAEKPVAKALGAKSFYGEEHRDELGFPTPVITDRGAVRQEIASTTAAKRNRFFIEKKDFFLPLLPPNNYVKKISERHEALHGSEKGTVPSTTPYEEIEVQPSGIKATMKPYQLSGLSFLLYLHRNGLSGILGDEMGLGKTLQTLSLFQYLKENEPTSGDQLRPFLVVCPMSVLSSWMAEARKWAPEMKVLRFHGPAKERDRLKKIAAGEIDMFGNLTSKQRAKLRTRRTATGKPIISLDTDSEVEEEGGVDLVVTTYESYQAEQVWFKRAFVWRYVVLDEGHKIKNDLSLISKSLQGLQAEYRLILTGTPVQNNLAELWALLHWLYQDVFTEQSNDLFRTSFDLTKGLYSKQVLDNSRHLLELIMIRRMKNSPGVDLNLPPKTEVLLFVPLTPMQRFWYTRLITRADQGLLDELFRGAKDKEQAALQKDSDLEAELLRKDVEAFEALDEKMVIGSDEWKESREILARTIERERQIEVDGAGKSSAWQKLMNLLMQLRKVCNHPYQIPNAEPDPYELGHHIIRASGKFIVLEKLISELVIRQKRKILIFSGFTKMLDLVEDFLHISGGDGSQFKYARLDGGTGRARRNLGIRMFNDVESEYRVMLISTRAGGLGINLASASDVVLLDQDWNPQITLQAEARAHRIGQNQPVTIYKLVSQGTVEEQMMGRIQKKLYLSAKVTESMQDIHTKAGRTKKGPGGRVVADDDMPQMNTGQLMALVRRGASALSRPEVDVNDMLSWDWVTTVSKCKDQPFDISVKKDAIPDAKVDTEAENKWLGEMERVEAHIFEGKRLERSRGQGPKGIRDIASEWNRERADRRIGKNTTVMVDGFAINKESMSCRDWEAVPTMAGRDPRLAEPKRAKKAKINSQSHCQICLDGGELHLCGLCPRAYHFGCLDKDFKSKSKGVNFICPQHQCADCEQKTTDAGGMLYRCRWCERAFCEDCLDFDKTRLLGETLVEYDLLEYPATHQAFYIQCHQCTEHFVTHPEDKALCDHMANEVEAQHQLVRHSGDGLDVVEADSESRASSLPPSLTDAATVETTGANTPIIIPDDDFETSPARNTRKRKAGDGGNLRLSFKRERSDGSSDLVARLGHVNKGY